MEKVYYIIYVVISLYLRTDLIIQEAYLKIFFSIGLGLLGLFVGVKAIKEKKAGFHSVSYHGKDAERLGIIAVVVSILIMFFLR